MRSCECLLVIIVILQPQLMIVMMLQALPDEDDTTENGVCAVNIAYTSSFMESFFEQVR